MKLGAAMDEVCQCEFPARCDEILSQCGDIEVESPHGGTISVAEIVGVCEAMPETFESPQDFQEYVYGLAPREFVGLHQYDDRGTTVGYSPAQSF